MSWQDFQAKYMELANNSPYIAGIKRPGQTIQRMQYYCYDTQITTIAGNSGKKSNTIETQADSDFALTYISGGNRFSATSDLTYNANILIQITDQATGKPFFNIPTLLPLVAGAGGFPFLLAAPRVIAPNTSLLVEATNRQTSSTYQVEIALHGTRIFYQ